MYPELTINLADRYFLSRKNLAKGCKKPLLICVVCLMYGIFSGSSRAQFGDLIQQSSNEPPGIEVLKDRESTDAMQEQWEERLLLAEQRQGKKEKDWSTHVLENAMFPVLAAVVVAGWYFGDQIPVLNLT